jgi:hypothetical protein
MVDKTFAFEWKTDIFARLLVEPLDTVIEIPVKAICHPRHAGMYRIESKGEDRRPQYGLILNEKLACHVVICGDWYHARLYVHRSAQLAQTAEPEVLERNETPLGKRKVGPSSLATLVADNPGLALAAAALVGAFVGAALSSKKKRAASAGAGAGVGAAVALLMVALETANTSPSTSEAAQNLFAMLASLGLAGRPASRRIRLKPPSRAANAANTAPKKKPKVKTKKTFDDGIPV